MSNFLNNSVAIKKYNSYSCKIKEILNHLGHENCRQKHDVGTEPWQQHWNIWQLGVKLKLSFSSDNETKNSAIAVQYQG